tara:strand:+ start:642 stop:1169 length:528 start_codon:yes stop_codon:yes gene_type:complete
MKLMICGHGRHGKDVCAEIIHGCMDLTFGASSWVLAEEVVYPVLKDKYDYRTLMDCFDDRSNHRAEWFDLLQEYNTPDDAKLGRKIFAKYDMYVGIRRAEEFFAVQSAGLFDLSIWVDASERLPPEGTDSCTVQPWMCDIIIQNNGTQEDFKVKIRNLCKNLKVSWKQYLWGIFK